MIKVLSASVLMLCSAMPAMALDSICHTSTNDHGKTICGLGVIDNIDARGALILNNTQVNQKVRTAGSLVSNQASIGSVTASGHAMFSNSLIKKGLNIHGYTNSDSSIFGGTCDIDGHLETNSSQFLGKVHIQGYADAINSKFSKSLDIHGQLNAINSNFNEAIDTSATAMDFDHSTLASIHFVLPHKRDPLQKQVLTLTDNSIVKGDVQFQNGKGLVIMDKTSQIEGTVTGGKIQHMVASSTAPSPHNKKS